MSIQITAEQKNLLKNYKTEAYAPLADIETANANFKEIVETAAESTGVDKKIITKYFKLSYKDQVGEQSEQMEVIKFLSE